MRRTDRFLWVSAATTASSILCFVAVRADTPQGWTNNGNIDHTTITQSVAGDIHVYGKIDGGSNVNLTSTNGSITIDGKIDGASRVILYAPNGDIHIGLVGAEGDKKIDGSSIVSAFSGGTITLGNKIDGGGAVGHVDEPTRVFFRAKNGIDIGDKIDGGVSVDLCTASGQIHVRDKIDNSNTRVWYWPQGALVADSGIQGGQVNPDQKRACQGPGIAGFPTYPL